MSRYTLFIGYGNSLRRDDGAGLALATKLAAYWRRHGHYVRQVQVQQLTPDLAFDITASDVDAVIFVDASIAPAGNYADEENTASQLAIKLETLEVTAVSASLGHHMDPGELLVYAELLYRRRPPAWLITVPGLDFSFGDKFSAPVVKLLDTAHVTAAELMSLVKP